MTDERQLKWDLRFLKLAEEVASYSKDPSTKVGAVLVDERKNVVATGYNGFPRGVKDTTERYNDREQKYPLVAHAELNAIINAGHAARGCTIYVVPTLMIPCACPECAKAIVQAGIVENVFWHKDVLEERWEKMAKYTSILFDEGGVKYRGVKRPEETTQAA